MLSKDISVFHFITQGERIESHIEQAEAACKAGCDWIQLRLKGMSAQQCLEGAAAVMRLAQQYEVKLIMNDYPNIAKELGTYGVHLGQQDMPVAEARKIIGENGVIGGTANTFEHIKALVADGVDYIGLGPYRYTTTKAKLSPILGLAGYQQIRNQCIRLGITIPIIAIGGITLDDLPLLSGTGVHGIAASGLLINHPHKAQAIEQINTTFQQSKKHQF